jgi:hypothetical protein
VTVIILKYDVVLHKTESTNETTTIMSMKMRDVMSSRVVIIAEIDRCRESDKGIVH